MSIKRKPIGTPSIHIKVEFYGGDNMGNERKTKNKKPLLYIHQPELREVKSNMQSNYRSPNIKTDSAKQKESVSIVKKKKREYLQEDLDSIQAEMEIEQEEQGPQSQPQPKLGENTGKFGFKKVKPFREMDLNEKLDYLTEFGDGKAPFPCVFTTENNSYKGVIFSANGTEVEIKPFQGEHVKLNKNDIKSIKMIGL
jgi:Spore coat protein CotO